MQLSLMCLYSCALPLSLSTQHWRKLIAFCEVDQDTGTSLHSFQKHKLPCINVMSARTVGWMHTMFVVVVQVVVIGGGGNDLHTRPHPLTE